MRRRRKISQNNSFYFDNILIDFEKNKKKLFLEKDYEGLENLLKKSLFQIQLYVSKKIYDKVLTEVCQKSLILLEDLKRNNYQISIDTYNSINLLECIYELEETADELGQDLDDGIYSEYENEEKESQLENIEEVVSILIKVFNNYAQKYPETIEIPSDETLDFLLSIENDWDFELLLIGFAKTKHPRVIKILQEFADDLEKDVRDLAKMLLIETPKISNKSQLKNDLKALLAEGELLATLKKLLEICKANDNIDLTNDVYFQLGRNSTLEKGIMRNMISYQDQELTRAQIRFAVINLIDQI